MKLNWYGGLGVFSKWGGGGDPKENPFIEGMWYFHGTFSK